MKSFFRYRTAAGLEPPNSARVPSSVRVSTTILMSPACSSIDSTGSRCEIASSSPLRIAATAEAALPTPMNEASCGVRPSLASRKLTSMLVDDPGAVTPIFMPLRSLGVL